MPGIWTGSGYYRLSGNEQARNPLQPGSEWYIGRHEVMVMDDRASADFPEFLDEATEVWDRIAEWWDDQIGGGNAVQDLLEPITERLLELREGSLVLDIACGAARFARRMASLGARVVAIDHSERFIQRARQRAEGRKDEIECRVLNAADQAALLSLGLKQFDAAVRTMALMDMASIEPRSTLRACWFLARTL